jgi:heme exporter protein C
MKMLNHPAAFRAFSRIATPLFAILGLLLLAPALYMALVASPVDYQQGETVRIMYVHVPAAWGALLIYLALGIAAFTAFIWKHALADVFVEAAAPVGAVLATLCLITGSLWGKPMWGTWWVWDARLTSMLALFFFYLGAIALRGAFADEMRGAKASQILLLLGLINLPIVKFSVDWWNTLHQSASVLRKGGSAIAPEMMVPLLLSAACGFCLCAALILLRMETTLWCRGSGKLRE